jgi:hypothetical protein
MTGTSFTIGCHDNEATLIEQAKLYKVKVNKHTEDVVRREIKRRKIEAISSLPMFDSLNRSITTNSYYTTIKGVDVRISDHLSKTFSGLQILVGWNTDVKGIEQRIIEISKDFI